MKCHLAMAGQCSTHAQQVLICRWVYAHSKLRHTGLLEQHTKPANAEIMNLPRSQGGRNMHVYLVGLPVLVTATDAFAKAVAIDVCNEDA